ncbi:hypothetical protein [Algoriphagus sediminis]|uniref:DUF4221 domain-containing protein n=1 Tax=Algoriphagus sediminis TaxID=3057113 RepID=A0ABT7YG02_9BACT|nr:hypothetical protein [Algoriphagus sediminis]MDN3205463.1 hypothetical protein [Algoriphagus sediminis]
MKRIIVPILFILGSCTTKEIKEYSLNPISNSAQLNDEIILAGVSSLDYEHGKFLVTEYDYDRFYYLDEDLQTSVELGNPENPDFPSFPTDANFYDNGFWIYSSEKRSLNLFNGIDISKSILVDSDSQLKNFHIQDDKILFSRVSFEGKPFVLHDLKSNQRTYFGEYFKDQRTPFFNHYFRDSFSFITENGFVFVMPYIGLIQKYDKSFILADELCLLNESGFSEAKKWVELQYEKSDNTLISMFSDCQVVDGSLFLLTYDRNPNSPVNPRYVYEIDISNSLRLKAKYSLGSDQEYFTKFAHIESRRFAFYEFQTSSIKFFQFFE